MFFGYADENSDYDVKHNYLLEDGGRNADSGLRILFILGKTTDC